MLNKTSLYRRLFLCLLLSAGVHGGLVYFGWLEAPVHFAVRNPVEVSFLPVVDVAPPTVEQEKKDTHEPVEKPVPKPREVVKPNPNKLSPVIPEKKVVAKAPEKEAKAIEAVQEVVVNKVSEPVPETNTEPGADFTAPAAPKIQDNAPAATVAAPVIVEAVPRYSGNPLPEYPYLARQRHWEGVVWLLVDVSADGSVADLRVEQSSGHKILDRSATRTVARWRFEPATRAGIPVASQVRIPVRFRLEGS